jgi:hypothetical protein
MPPPLCDDGAVAHDHEAVHAEPIAGDGVEESLDRGRIDPLSGRCGAGQSHDSVILSHVVDPPLNVTAGLDGTRSQDTACETIPDRMLIEAD